jgi:hypothetical protein
MDLVAAVLFSAGVIGAAVAGTHHVTIGVVASVIVMVIAVFMLLCSLTTTQRGPTHDPGTKRHPRW